MKAFKARATGRPSPEVALAAANEAAPRQPPATVPDDRTTTLNLRVKATTVFSLSAIARERGLTQKQLIMQVLSTAGIDVAQADLEDRTPRRKM